MLASPPSSIFTQERQQLHPSFPEQGLLLCLAPQTSRLVPCSTPPVPGQGTPPRWCPEVPAPLSCLGMGPLVVPGGPCWQREAQGHTGPAPSCSGRCALSAGPGRASPGAGFSLGALPVLCPGEFSARGKQNQFQGQLLPACQDTEEVMKRRQK